MDGLVVRPGVWTRVRPTRGAVKHDGARPNPLGHADNHCFPSAHQQAHSNWFMCKIPTKDRQDVTEARTTTTYPVALLIEKLGFLKYFDFQMQDRINLLLILMQYQSGNLQWSFDL
jgi:hypothetical protein